MPLNARGRWTARLGLLLAGLLAIGVAGAQPDAPPSASADAFDHYTLALTWHPGFCASRRSPPRECREPRLREAAGEGFVLHGLWPSRPERVAEAGVSRRQWRAEGCFGESPRPDGGFCRAHAPFELPASLAARLDRAMPGRASCLDRHEYAKHAACLAIAPTDYFATALELLAAVNASAFADFVVIHQGGVVARNDLIAAFEAAFGEGRGRALQLVCAGRGNRRLTEVRIGIRAAALDGFPAAGSLVALRRGRCASRVRVTAVRD
ncbi:ribonuclease T2 family protein [Modicisalibacter tunisiensis]|uniref:ribonuclease T2 family protein n=1 Tax=Modicisalibacter tunisiensis TaxID=390637 RepID=UPI001CC95395|nr:ribonuclease I [Modicisalibacter tunisiensis]